MGKRFYILEEQANNLRNMGLNVNAVGSCTYSVADYDGISYTEERTMILQDILDVLIGSGLFPTLYYVGGLTGHWACTVGCIGSEEQIAKTSLDAAYLVLYDCLQRGLISKNYLIQK